MFRRLRQAEWHRERVATTTENCTVLKPKPAVTQ